MWKDISKELPSLLRIKIPRKVKCFTWQVLHGHTNDGLACDEVALGPFCCILCWKVKEDFDHIFWLCDFVRVVWIFLGY